MQYAAIPTTYNGIEFRSRLEAKWAFVFDELGYRWEYEPLDMGGYIPDFSIASGGKLYFVEVKPAFTSDDLWEMSSKARIACEESQSSLLVLGASPAIPATWPLKFKHGMLWKFHKHASFPRGAIMIPYHAFLNRPSKSRPHAFSMVDICKAGDDDGVVYETSDCYRGVCFPGHLSTKEIKSIWAMAVNATKYRHGRHT